MALPSTHASGCQPTTRVVIGGTEVPTVSGDDGEGGVEVQMRKTGPADITRYADVHIPFEWGGEDVLAAISMDSDNIDAIFDGAFMPSLSNINNDSVRIDVLDTVKQQYIPVMHGPIGGIGPSTLTGAFRIQVSDWANYLESIGADRQFNAPTLQSVFKYVAETVSSHGRTPTFGIQIPQSTDATDLIFGRNIIDAFSGGFQTEDFSDEGIEPDNAGLDLFFDTLDGGDLNDSVGRAIGLGLSEIEEQIGYDKEYITNQNISKSFSQYEHTLCDVLDWVTTLYNARWYVDYDISGDRPVIVFDPNPTQPLYDTHPLNSDPSSGAIALSNNALFQLSPQHTLAVRGQRQNKSRPEVIVQYQPLVNRVGRNPTPKYREIDATKLADAEQRAKHELKSILDGASGGEIVTKPFAMAAPYTRVTAEPTCNGNTASGVESITYEIEEVIHDLSTDTQRHGGPRTLLRCGLHVDSDDMFIRRSVEVDM